MKQIAETDNYFIPEVGEIKHMEPFKVRQGRIGRCKCGGELVASGIQMDWVVDLKCIKCFKEYKLD